MKEFKGKKILVNLWNGLIDILITLKTRVLIIFDFFLVKLFASPNVKTINQTIDKINTDKCSISRYGDGELKLIAGKDISFQKHSPLLEKRLKEILISSEENHIVCIPDVFGDNSQYTITYAKAWKDHLIRYRLKWYKNLDKKKVYYNSFISRCYLCFQDKKVSKRLFDSIKRIWHNRDIVIVEGEYSRLGVDNDLFDNTKSIRRVLCPKKDAFSLYDKILKTVKTFNRDALILIALGPTATVLAYDLYKEGYQVIDIGHIDIEYEWYLKGATKKIPIKNKFINEVNGGVFEEEEINSQYFSQIVYNVNSYSEIKKLS